MGNGISIESILDPEIPQVRRDQMILEMQVKTYEHVKELRKAFAEQPEKCAKTFVGKAKFAWLTMLVLTIVTCLLTKAVS